MCSVPPRYRRYSCEQNKDLPLWNVHPSGVLGFSKQKVLSVKRRHPMLVWDLQRIPPNKIQGSEMESFLCEAKMVLRVMFPLRIVTS